MSMKANEASAVAENTYGKYIHEYFIGVRITRLLYQESNTFTPEKVHVDYTSYSDVGEVAALSRGSSRGSRNVFLLFFFKTYALRTSLKFFVAVKLQQHIDRMHYNLILALKITHSYK
jgi:hypothetical protein